jgi:hypothetical protein
MVCSVWLRYAHIASLLTVHHCLSLYADDLVIFFVPTERDITLLSAVFDTNQLL